jgi:ArsR family transcriptional regulator, arsenate/arsenite/antimonite-responsive transcriptional repressor
MMEISEMFKALAVETRVRILELLKTQGPLGAKEIARLTGVTPAAASQHLKVLKQAGLVRSERQGYWIPYALNPEALEEYRRRLSEVCTCGCQGSGQWQDQERRQSSLEDMEQYEKDLLNELDNVRQRIEELKLK